MEVRVETRALQQLEKALRESGRGIKPMATGILRGTFEKLVNRGRERAVAKGTVTGTLVRGIKLLEFNGFDSPTKLIGRYGATEDSVKHTGGSYIRETQADIDSYAFYVEMGREKGKTQPPAKDIARWLTQKHWQFRYKGKKGQEMSAEFRNLPTKYQYIIAKAFAKGIGQRGIAARRFVFGDSAGNLHVEDMEIIDNDLNNLAERIANQLAHSEEG